MKSNEIDFALCDILYKLNSVLESFPNEELRSELKNIMSSIQEKKLQVAVVGEFRRGKSSLINALLGMPVLPVDIEPTTAAINRITYGVKPCAIIHYKNGQEKEVPLSELSNYVTKLTPMAEETAQKVQEAEVRYPTELCRNHIDMIDTPGLNDTVSMTAVTEQMLQEIHVAIVAIRASMPYSETECYWVTRLLSLPNLQHIVFVLTCMDLVPKMNRDTIISFAEKRICTKTMEKVKEQYAGNRELCQKAERIFSESNFRIHPVSAKMALDSFGNGDYELLEQSNIPSLKKELIIIMNAQQQMKGAYDTRRFLDKMEAELLNPHSELPTVSLRKQQEDMTKSNKLVNDYFSKRSALMEQCEEIIKRDTEAISLVWLSERNIEELIKKTFVTYLQSASENTSDAISSAILSAQSEVNTGVLPSLRREFQKAVNASIIKGVNWFLAKREEELQYTEYKVLLKEGDFLTSEEIKSQIVGQLQMGIEDVLPEFSVHLPGFLLNHNIIQTVIIPYIGIFGKKYRNAWKEAIAVYAQKWKAVFIEAEPLELNMRFDHQIHTAMGALEERIESLSGLYDKAQLIIQESKVRVESMIMEERG